MPVFLHNGALHAFVHVPKCGGTTVEDMLRARVGEIGLLDERYYGRTEPHRWSKSSPQHLVWDDFIRLLPDTMIGHVFAVVRHPLTRFASSYNFYARAGAVPAGMGPEEWFARVAGTERLLPFRADNHLRRQVDFVPERATVFHLEDGLGAVADWLDATFATGSGPTRDGNVAPDPDPKRFRVIEMPTALQAKIETHYADDYARFGYQTDPGRDVTLTWPLASGSLARRFRIKLWARRGEHLFRRLESRALSAATQVQHGRRAEA